jgi:hypothetical protein
MTGYLDGMVARVFSLARQRRFACFALAALLSSPLAAADVPLTQLRNETRKLLRHEAIQEAGNAKDAATTALCDLYVVLRNDDRYPTSEMLQGDAVKIRRRLLTIARRRAGQLKRKKIDRPSNLSTEVESAIAAALAQKASDELPDAADPAGQGGAALPDTGWQLVELIQRVVAPDFWDRQGGPGAIRYFAMRRVLVVRATSDVHEQVRDLLMALR